MHLKAMLLLVLRLIHGIKVALLAQLSDSLRIDGEVAQGSLIGSAFRQGAAGQVVVMRRAEEEDAFAVSRYLPYPSRVNWW